MRDFFSPHHEEHYQHNNNNNTTNKKEILLQLTVVQLSRNQSVGVEKHNLENQVSTKRIAVFA